MPLSGDGGFWSAWEGDQHVSRVSSLYKLKATAAHALWTRAADRHAKKPGENTQAKVEEYRTLTKVFSREWYEYAKAAGKDTQQALQLCVSAAGTSDYCEAG